MKITVRYFASIRESMGHGSETIDTSAAWGDGVVDNPAGQTIAAGDTVRFIAFSELLS